MKPEAQIRETKSLVEDPQFALMCSDISYSPLLLTLPCRTRVPMCPIFTWDCLCLSLPLPTPNLCVLFCFLKYPVSMVNHKTVLYTLRFTDSKILHGTSWGMGWFKDQAGQKIPDCTPTAILLLYLFCIFVWFLNTMKNRYYSLKSL